MGQHWVPPGAAEASNTAPRAPAAPPPPPPPPPPHTHTHRPNALDAPPAPGPPGPPGRLQSCARPPRRRCPLDGVQRFVVGAHIRGEVLQGRRAGWPTAAELLAPASTGHCTCQHGALHLPARASHLPARASHLPARASHPASAPGARPLTPATATSAGTATARAHPGRAAGACLQGVAAGVVREGVALLPQVVQLGDGGLHACSSGSTRRERAAWPSKRLSRVSPGQSQRRPCPAGGWRRTAGARRKAGAAHRRQGVQRANQVAEAVADGAQVAAQHLL